jgi:hypothetical protein
LAMLGFAGVTPNEVRVAAVTLRFVDPDIPPRVAVIVVEPGAKALAIPFEPGVLLTDATLPAEVFHVTELVRSWVE